MASFCCDANGNQRKIKTDILVAGYVRDIVEEFTTRNIPDEIIQLCFMFWFVTVCDEWDKSMTYPTHEIMEIDGDVFRWKDGYERGKDDVYLCTAFGTKIVEH